MQYYTHIARFTTVTLTTFSLYHTVIFAAVATVTAQMTTKFNF
jgi:hypothetical protein